MWPLLAGAAIGAIGGLMSDSPKNLTSTSQTGGSSQSQGTWSPHQATQPGYGFLAGNAQNLMGKPVPYFPGQGYVGPSSPTQFGVNSAMGAAGQMDQPLNTMMGNYNFLSGAADVANNPYVQGQLGANERSVEQQLREQWMPQVNRGAQAVNAMGGGRHGIAQAQGVERAGEQLSRTNAATMLDAYGKGLGAQEYALGQTGNVLQNMLAPSQTQMQAGQAVEGYQGRALQDAMRRFSHQYQEPYQRMQNLSSTLGFLQPMGTQYGSGVNTGQSTGTSPNPSYQAPMQRMIGGAMSGIGVGNMFGG